MIKLTNAQAETVRLLQEKLNAASNSLQVYLSYLNREHNIPMGEEWRVNPELGYLVKVEEERSQERAR